MTTRSKNWLVVVLVLLIGAVPGGVGLFVIRQSTNVAAPDLFVDPGDLLSVSNSPWYKRPPAEMSDSEITQVWSAKPTGGGPAFFEKVSRYRNSVIARWYYWSTPRKSFEKDYPGFVHDFGESSQLAADESDLFCVDIYESTASQPKCPLSVFWARYGQFIVYVSMDSAEDGRQKFGDVIAAIDEHASKVLGIR